MTHFPIRRWPAVLAALAFIALIPLASAGAAGATEPPRITGQEVKRLADKDEVVIVDVRTKDAYDLEHAEGAVSIPLSDLERRMAELPKDKMIAAYCT